MRTIVTKDAAILRKIAQPVSEKLFGSKELHTLTNDMAAALDKQPEGVALAAPQVGVSYRFFIVRIYRVESYETLTTPTEPKEAEVQAFINPEIVKTSRRRTRADEGCLSVPGVYGTTTPHERVTIRARRADGTRFERGAGGLLAQVFEHEVNHLNGILFTDHAEHLVEIPHESQEKSV